MVTRPIISAVVSVRAAGRSFVKSQNRPAMIAVRDDPLAIVERHLEAGTILKHRRQAHHPADAPALIVEQIALDDLAHGRPAEGRGNGRVERERRAHLRGLHEHDPLRRDRPGSAGP